MRVGDRLNIDMASGGDSVDGDGPEKVEDLEKEGDSFPSSPKQSWANIPSPVFLTLFSKMDTAFVHTARQVCPTWLSHTDNEIGLRVKIDEAKPGNLEFVQNVKIIQARVVNWENARNPEEPSSSSTSSSTSSLKCQIFQFPNCLRKLTLSGRMPEGWKIRNLPEFTTLSHLVLRGAALHSQDLTGFPLPDVTENIEYEAYEPNTSSPVWMRKLKKLEIIMNEFSYPSSLPLSVRLHDPERAIQHQRFLRSLYFVVVNNATFILNNVRSPVLHALQIYIYPKSGIILPTNINWKHLPLQKFLENHKRTLRELYLPEFEGKCDNTENDLSSFPTKLTKLQATFSIFTGDMEESREQSMTYWKHFLMEQSNLTDAELTFNYVPSDLITEALASLSFQSKEKLTYVDLMILSEDLIQLNMEIFAFCQNLEILKITSSNDQGNIIVSNFSRLPRSLKKIRMNLLLIQMPEPEQMDKFVNLEMLEIVTLLVLDQSHQQTVEFLRKVIQLRKLSLLSLSYDQPGNNNHELMALFEALDNQFHRLYSSFFFKLNLSYEFESGWGEERFDESKNSVEYINTREPEEYSTWHRNAISVDDEDHRVFIFQTLPFLLDLRRRRHAADNEGDDGDDDTESDNSDVSSYSQFAGTSPERMETPTSEATSPPPYVNDSTTSSQGDNWD